MQDAYIQQYDVVVNHEQQYSIWPSWKEVPAGWQLTGFRGGREESLEHIRKVWIDLRPASVRVFSSSEGV
jgi:MbtH protein